MAVLPISEVFGYPVEDLSDQAQECREKRRCPFKGGACNKDKLSDPLGVCSLSDGRRLAVTCPNRFLEEQRIFRDAGRVAFGSDIELAIVPEIRLLRGPTPANGTGAKTPKLAKVDFIIAPLDKHESPTDFAALEIQAVYISGRSIRPAFYHFIETGALPEGSARRPDLRSSAQKRLIPQLSLKLPIFRRWGKKVFVAVDSHFFGGLPTMETVETFGNSEIVWLVYPFERVYPSTSYNIGAPDIHFTTWENVQTALREGTEPTKDEIMDFIEIKIKKNQAQRILIQ